MPELPELEALRIRLAPRLEGKLITAATVNPKKAHMLRYPVENFANELPARRIVSLSRRGKHLVFGTELNFRQVEDFPILTLEGDGVAGEADEAGGERFPLGAVEDVHFLSVRNGGEKEQS